MVFKTVVTKSGVTKFNKNFAFEVKTYDMRYFKEHLMHLSYRQMVELIDKELEDKLSVVFSGSELTHQLMLSKVYLQEQQALDKLLIKASSRLTLTMLNWCTEHKFRMYLDTMQRQFKESGIHGFSNKDILEKCKPDDLEFINLFRKEIGLEPLEFEDLEYSDLDKWVLE